MGYLPYQLVQDFWTINSLSDFPHLRQGLLHQTLHVLQPRRRCDDMAPTSIFTQKKHPIGWFSAKTTGLFEWIMKVQKDGPPY